MLIWRPLFSYAQPIPPDPLDLPFAVLPCSSICPPPIHHPPCTFTTPPLFHPYMPTTPPATSSPPHLNRPGHSAADHPIPALPSRVSARGPTHFQPSLPPPAHPSQRLPVSRRDGHIGYHCMPAYSPPRHRCIWRPPQHLPTIRRQRAQSVSRNFDRARARPAVVATTGAAAEGLRGSGGGVDRGDGRSGLAWERGSARCGVVAVT